MTVTAELLAAAPASADRRRSQRYKPAQSVATLIGRGTGALIDLSATGARIRHTSAVARGAHVRIRFDWNRQRFEAIGEVLASRVAGITGEGTQFESRVRFLPLSPASAEVLERALADLGNGDLRKWVANLHGWTEEEAEAAVAGSQATTAQADTFVLCRLVNRRWVQRVTRNPKPPVDGFTVASGTEPSEIRALCRTFEQCDAEGRRLLQLITSAVFKPEGGAS